jgi:electron transfer flavoprotein beta subunit
MKWVGQRPEIDRATGAVHPGDDRFGGVSPADRAALEWALRCAERWGGDVVAVSAGPVEADAILRDALAVGATRAIRIDQAPFATSPVVASVLATTLEGCDLVWCGDLSTDRGSGSVPAFLAGRLEVGQALGVVEVRLRDEPGRAEVVRRLDGGRRERLAVNGPAVLSVEGAAARLRRAPLAAAIAARSGSIEVAPGTPLGEHPHRPTRPYRPRARTLAGPAGDGALERVRALTALGTGPRGDPIELDPGDAADRILDALRDWGYLDPERRRWGGG